ncbi:hypothetical protein Rmf_36100 [Roseomonas fluvialis]|uniref:Uncharacterized protein n=1 Tax=Roseomonas fluvialis TaxID=1750527 RepID=A0ABN6P4V7_9PROT|nr:hypothetical protein Rmf_36100 [Roseomonas fluvialis]
MQRKARERGMPWILSMAWSFWAGRGVGLLPGAGFAAWVFVQARPRGIQLPGALGQGRRAPDVGTRQAAGFGAGLQNGRRRACR